MATAGVAFVAELSKEADKQVAALQGQLRTRNKSRGSSLIFSGALEAGHPSEAGKGLAAHKKQLELLATKDAEYGEQDPVAGIGAPRPGGGGFPGPSARLSARDPESRVGARSEFTPPQVFAS